MSHHPFFTVRRFIFIALFASAMLRAETIDLATALRLSGANNLDVELARNSVRQAEAKHAETRNRFFPWFTAGTGYRRVDGNTQDILGDVVDVSKQNYQAGVGVVGEIRFGEAIYQNLAAKQRAVAASHALESMRRSLHAEVSTTYFNLLKSQATMRVSQQSKSLATDYETQVTAAVVAGVAFDPEGARRHPTRFRQTLRTAALAKRTRPPRRGW
jgi:outer membrane protein TolC